MSEQPGYFRWAGQVVTPDSGHLIIYICPCPGPVVFENARTWEEQRAVDDGVNHENPLDHDNGDSPAA